MAPNLHSRWDGYRTAECAGGQKLGERGLQWWTRPLDLLLVGLTLPLWAPAMIVVALWITLASKGPVIFWQERIGLRGNRFTMFKFRSMKVCVETKSHASHFTRLIESDAPMTKLDAACSSRSIPLGAFLRAAGLDELPQIFNVIRGDMSLVDPRDCRFGFLLKLHAKRAPIIRQAEFQP